ncbi:unnamed protein product, partial [Polarella glacialis]
SGPRQGASGRRQGGDVPAHSCSRPPRCPLASSLPRSRWAARRPPLLLEAMALMFARAVLRGRELIGNSSSRRGRRQAAGAPASGRSSGRCSTGRWHTRQRLPDLSEHRRESLSGSASAGHCLWRRSPWEVTSSELPKTSNSGKWSLSRTSALSAWWPH